MLGEKFDKNKFIAYQIEVNSFDGEKIPVTLIHKKNLKRDRKNKLLLNVYGFYGLNLEIEFSIVNLKALEENWIIGYAHVRGGNEKGSDWHRDAIVENKYKSFMDYKSVAEELIRLGLTHNSLLCGYGGSAGASIVA